MLCMVTYVVCGDICCVWGHMLCVVTYVVYGDIKVVYGDI